MAGQKTLKIKLNADLELVTRWKVGGVPQELTGGLLQVRAEDNPDGDPIIEVVGTVDGAPDHWIRFVKLAADLPDDLTEGKHLYDVVVTYGAGPVRTKDLLEGAAIISKGITR